MLGLAQHADTMSLFTILDAIINHLQNRVSQANLNADRARSVIEHISRLQQIVHRLQMLKPDDTEYAYLRALVLFSNGKIGFYSLYIAVIGSAML